MVIIENWNIFKRIEKVASMLVVRDGAPIITLRLLPVSYVTCHEVTRTSRHCIFAHLSRVISYFHEGWKAGSLALMVTASHPFLNVHVVIITLQ